jgi:hypothetical protein
VGTKSSTVTNNSTFTKGDRFQKGKGKGKGCGSQSSFPNRHNNSKGKSRGKGQHRQNHKGKGKGHSKGNRTQLKDPCAYCHKNGHEARECRKRLYDEKQGTKQTEQTNNAQNVTFLQVEDETSFLFRNNATFFLTEPNHDADPSDTDTEDEANHTHPDTHTDNLRSEDNDLAESEDDRESTAYLPASIQMVPVLPEIRSRSQDNLITPSTTEENEGKQESSSVAPTGGQYEQTISDVSLWENPNPNSPINHNLLS